MTEPATRTRTFVFTDIESSTQHLRELGREYHRALREHDRIIATATAAHSGEVFGSEGDA
jgi:class 3 adenylate cyclase